MGLPGVLRPCLECGALSEQSRCPEHRAAQERAREARRPGRRKKYDRDFRALRKWWEPRVAAGGVRCRRAGDGCLLEPDTMIEPGTPWQLGHPDTFCSRETHPEHERCNEHYGGREVGLL